MDIALLEKVSQRLARIVEDVGYTIDVDDTYLTSVVINDQGKQVVDYSESLSWAVMEKVQADELPEFSDDYAGVFAERWTFEPDYRVPGLSVEQVRLFGCEVVESFRNR
ncbi:hypothetical protein PS662_01276 [Pseudomonas fluorescens]|uniref:Uncharacterized protein n=1 Tax=Pseudomonas fluorescens TaxID=294 RepID=A0A5E6QXQ9_PSEFL|nr:hypothetical protein [Pseudomonas fluorescens]VVM60315.1 hypothetical protein PS662_01276 [Pseudomonas fluorescens]